MRHFGFSTGAIALGDFVEALRRLSAHDVSAVELSALRFHELEPLIRALESLDVARYAYVSLHAPSNIPEREETFVVELLKSVARRKIPIVLHPDTVRDWSLWTQLGAAVLLENMDKRKEIGRTAVEMRACFDRLPDAGLCFDIGHARQVDPSLVEGRRILEQFSDRLRQLHISEVGSDSTHDRISWGAAKSFSTLASMIPSQVPIVIESVVRADQIANEIARARASFGEVVFPGVDALVGAA